MILTFGAQLFEACLFGAVFSALYHAIGGSLRLRPWLALAVLLAGLAWIILFGLIKV